MIIIAPESVIEERTKCHLICDRGNVQMEERDVDNLRIKPIMERLKKEEDLMKKATSLFEIPKIF